MTLLDQHTHIGIDIDETLASTFWRGVEFFHEHGELLAIEKFEDLTEMYFDQIPHANIAREVNDALWYEFEGSEIGCVQASLIPFAREGISFLEDHRKNLTLITGRPEISPTKERTYEWIEKYFPELIENSPIYFTNSMPKFEVCNQLGITLLIDDFMENAINITSHGITCILLEKPWNKEKKYEHPLLIRARDWEEIITILSR